MNSMKVQKSHITLLLLQIRSPKLIGCLHSFINLVMFMNWAAEQGQRGGSRTPRTLRMAWEWPNFSIFSTCHYTVVFTDDGKHLCYYSASTTMKAYWFDNLPVTLAQQLSHSQHAYQTFPGRSTGTTQFRPRSGRKLPLPARHTPLQLPRPRIRRRPSAATRLQKPR